MLHHHQPAELLVVLGVSAGQSDTCTILVATRLLLLGVRRQDLAIQSGRQTADLSWSLDAPVRDAAWDAGAFMDRQLPAKAASLHLRRAVVAGCLDPDQATDRLFARAWSDSLAALPAAERRGALAGVTGHVAESVVEVLLAELGYQLLWHFTGPGRHGVDLIVLCPSGERVVAVEVKGTLRPNYWPRLSRRELVQMSGAWVDKADNPGMANWELHSQDVYGAVVLVNFAAMAYRAAVTADFSRLQPIRDLGQLADLGWLDQPS